MGKERREEREDKGGRGGGGEQPKKGRGFKGSDRKALVSVWWFWGNPPPRRLLTQEVRLLRCSAVVAE